MPKSFVQGATAILHAVIIGQLVIGTAALASPQSGQSNSDPFWSNSHTGSSSVKSSGGVDPFDPNSWWNEPMSGGSGSGGFNGTSSTGSNVDPWGLDNGTGGWDNSGPMSGGWGDMSSDPTGIYNSWSSGYSMNIRPTNSWWSNALHYTLALNKDYVGTINDYRKKYKAYGTADADDYIADKIINASAHQAGLLGFGAAMIPPAMDYLWKEWRGGSSSWGYGIGLGIGGGLDFMSIVRVETTMMLELAEVYGELPNDEDERADLATLPFIIGIGNGAANKLIANHLLINLVQKGVPASEVVDPLVNNPVMGMVMKPVHVSASRVATQLATKSNLPGVIGKIAGGIVHADKFVKSMPPVIKVLASAGIAWGLNEASARMFGAWAKKYYKAHFKMRMANTIHAIRSKPEAKGLVWLLLTKDVFKNLTMQDAKTYAAIVHHEMPLVKNTQWDERKQLYDAYRAEPKIIDEYMRILRRDLDINAKLYIVKLILAGMLMKGGTNTHDVQTLETLGVGLGLVPPPKVNIDQIKPNDIRRENLERYVATIERMEQGVNTVEVTRAHKAAQSKAEKKNPQFRKWPRAGQIILEEYEEADVAPVIDLAEDIGRKGAANSDDIRKAKEIANGLGVSASDAPTPTITTPATGTGAGSVKGTSQGNGPAASSPPTTGANSGTKTPSAPSADTKKPDTTLTEWGWPNQ